MPKGANGLRPGPSARRFLWSIGDEEEEEEEEEDGRRRTIVCRIWAGFFRGETDEIRGRCRRSWGSCLPSGNQSKIANFDRPEVGKTRDGDEEGMGMRMSKP